MKKLIVVLFLFLSSYSYGQTKLHWTFGPQLGYTYVPQLQRNNVQLIGNLQYRYNNFTIGIQSGWTQTLESKQIDFRMGARLQYNVLKW